MVRYVMSLANWIQRKRLENSLKDLTNRQLADIGITRGDIKNIVRGTYEHGK